MMMPLSLTMLLPLERLVPDDESSFNASQGQIDGVNFTEKSVLEQNNKEWKS